MCFFFIDTQIKLIHIVYSVKSDVVFSVITCNFVNYIALIFEHNVRASTHGKKWM